MVMRNFYEKKNITEHGKQDKGNNIWIVLKLFTTNSNENFYGEKNITEYGNLVHAQLYYKLLLPKVMYLIHLQIHKLL